MAKFNANEEALQNWFKACSDPEGADVIKAYLDIDFDPDTKNAKGKNGLQVAAEASQYRTLDKHFNLLMSALEEKYEKQPKALIKAIERNGKAYSISYRNGSHRSAQNKIGELHKNAKIELLDKDYWFENCGSENGSDIIKAYLDKGFNPDTRNAEGKNGLQVAAENSEWTTLKKNFSLLNSALETHYDGKPAKLVQAITNENGKVHSIGYRNGSHNAAKNEIVRLYKEAKIELLDKDYWFENCGSENGSAIIKAYLDKGFNPDTRKTKNMADLSLELLTYMSNKAMLPEHLVLKTAKETVIQFRDAWQNEIKHLPISQSATDIIWNNAERIRLWKEVA